ncbi:MAG: NAD(P)-dependent oxidoreductase [Bacteroidota bacterium]
MNILVTGTSGHLGEALAIRLKEKGHQVKGVDILVGPQTTFVGSISDEAFIQPLMNDIGIVIHAATLHKPHVMTHSKQAFIDTNITGTRVLLDAAAKADVRSFIFTSTTSTFGDAMRPADHEPAVWVTEDLIARPKNIYGVTKTAAEDLCQLFARNHGLPCVVLRVSRFFLEIDDNSDMRAHYVDDNIKVNEYLHRRADIEDMVTAHLAAIEKAAHLGFDKFIITATSPFQQSDLKRLHQNAPEVLRMYFPEYENIYKELGWQFFPRIGRVYVNQRARQILDWEPKYDFGYILQCLIKNTDYKSPLANQIGIKFYHNQTFEDGPYPVPPTD